MNNIYIKKALIIGLIILLALLFSTCSPELMPGTDGGGDNENDDNNDDYEISSIEDDDYEEDNDYSNATEINIEEEQEHTISFIGDKDYYKLYLLSNKKYRIQLYNISGFEPEIKLFESDGTSLIEMKNLNAYTDTYNWWGYDSDRNKLEEEIESIVHSPETDSVFYFSVQDMYDAHNTGEYKIKISEVLSIDNTTLTATPDETNFSIDISWEAIESVDGYKLYRTTATQDIDNPDYSSFVPITTLSETAYTDTNIEINTVYYYYVIAYLYDKEGKPSNVDSAEISINLTEPQNLSAEGNLSNLSIDVNWNEVTDADSYKLYRTTTTQDDIDNPNYDDFSLIEAIDGNTNTSYSDSDIQLNTTYYYYVISAFKNEKSEASNVDSAEISINLTEPQNLTAEGNLSNLSIDVSWDEVSDAGSYKLYRTTTAQDLENPNYDNFTLIEAIDGSTNTSYSDSNVELETTYYYYVRAVLLNVESDPSNADDAMLDITGTQDLTATPNQTDYAIDVSWTVIDGVDSYNLYRTTTTQDIENPNYADFTIIDNVTGQTTTTYQDTDIEYNIKHYYYIIGAVGGVEQGDKSNVDYATVVLSEPANLIAEPISQEFEISVDWDNIADADSYNIYRTTTAQDLENPTYADFTIIDNVTSNTYTDTDVESDTTYYYFVKAVINDKEGEPSNVDDAIFQWEEFKPKSDLINATDGRYTDKIEIILEDKYDNTNIVRYEIYRAEALDADPSTYIHIGDFNGNDPIGSIRTDTDVDSGKYYYYCVKIIMLINEQEVESDYSYFDSGVAGS